MGGTSGGFKKKQVYTEGQMDVLDLLQQLAEGGAGLAGQSNDYLSKILSGEGLEDIKKAAQNQFQQETVPGILNAFGADAKSSSALNQALAAGASNLNTNLASQLSQLQFNAAGQGFNQSMAPFQGILNAQPNAYVQKGTPNWLPLTSALIGAGGAAAGGYLGKPSA